MEKKAEGGKLTDSFLRGKVYLFWFSQSGFFGSAEGAWHNEASGVVTPHATSFIYLILVEQTCQSKHTWEQKFLSLSM